MKIRSMTATFGKLEHETLTLEPGLNVIEAPNEWGKSTWCAFLIAMLYGVETRVKSTKASLADKEHYAPWSGSPMSGRMELNWNGREITIERKSKGRIPMGDFSAYETDSGLPVPELTGTNCGQILLGVEKSVFQRGGFVRLNDMPLTQDEALRARLNALVTTGDETGDGQRLVAGLKELKNQCRHNKTGLIPKVEGEKAAIEEKLRELENLETQSGKLAQRREEVRRWLDGLENHDAQLRYEKSQADGQRVRQAEDACRESEDRLAKLQEESALWLPREEGERKLLQLRRLNQQALDLQMEVQMSGQTPEKPVPPPAFRDMDGQSGVDNAHRDAAQFQTLSTKRFRMAAFLLLTLAGGILCVWNWLAGGILAAVGAGLLIGEIVRNQKRAARRAALVEKYGSENPEQWISAAKQWAQQLADWEKQVESYRTSHAGLLARYEAVRSQTDALTENREQEQARGEWEQTIAQWDALAEAKKQADRARQHWQTIQAMAVTVEQPKFIDDLTYTEGETARLLSDARGELQQLSTRLSQYQGRMEALGDRAAMERELEKRSARLEKLEDTYAALTIALETLSQATQTLQRRFAPQISSRAQEIMGDFTGGRYDRIHLGEDLRLRSGAGEEDTLRDALWRSDGTADQLYLSLRLALAENLTPEAPLVLDDALVRFDDERLKAALSVLAREAEQKQVILFTCQSREKYFWENQEERK